MTSPSEVTPPSARIRIARHLERFEADTDEILRDWGGDEAERDAWRLEMVYELARLSVRLGAAHR